MNDAVMDLLMDRMDSRRGRRDRERDRMRDGEDGRRGVRGSGRSDRADYLEDERRGVRGSGRRDSRDYADYEDGRDYEDGEDMRRDRRDNHHSKLRLTKADMREWKQMMENVDGTRGPHYDMQQIMTVADKLGVKFEDFNEAEFCIAVNMMYSDSCKTLKKYASSDKLLELCAEMALDFLCDPDGPEPYEKLLMYYHCIVNA